MIGRNTMTSSSETDCPIPCPACQAKEMKLPKLDPLQIQDLSITLPSSGETISFTAATETFMKEHYPNLENTTYRVPAAFFYDHRGDLDLETNEEILSKEGFSRGRGSSRRPAEEVVIDRFQKDAVEKVVRRFHSWGAGRGEGLMILSEYKMQDYLRTALKNLRSLQARKTLVGDHDVMVIHAGSGAVVFVQVKSVRESCSWKTMRGKLRNAWEQVVKDEAAFRELNADLKSFISAVPVLPLVALPELRRSHLKGMGVCDFHCSRVLTKETLGSAPEFDIWLNKHLSQIKQTAETEALTLERCTELCGRYVGLASVVRIRTLREAVKKASAKIGKILLTPEQKEPITTGMRRQVILGEYGTGKSLVLAKMAEKIVAENKTSCSDVKTEKIVFIVSCTGVSHTRTMGRLRRSPNHLVAHLGSLIAEQSSSVRILSIADLFRYCLPDSDPDLQCLNPSTMAKLTRKIISMLPTAHVHILWDEVPFIPKWEWSPLKDLGDEHPETYIWITIATGTYITLDSGDPTGRVAQKIPPTFALSQLTRCMRMTRNGFKFYQALQDFLGDRGCSSTTSGNAVHGGVPLWYPMQDCHCGTSEPLDCICIQARLTHSLGRVWSLLKNINPSQVSIVLRDSKHQIDRFLFGVVMEACHQLNIPAGYLSTSSSDEQVANDCQDPPSTEMSVKDPGDSKCQIVDIFSYKGCESPVVIFVTPYGWPLVWDHHGGRHGWDDISPQISRALGQIVLITWPRREMDHFSRVAVLNMISSYSSFPLTVSEEEADFLKTMIGKFKEVLNVYSRDDRPDFLNYLLEKDVLMKCKA